MRAETSYIRTHSGGYFYPQDIPSLVPDINDIAHALSINNRYNGHLNVPYSVAQHSVLVMEEALNIFKSTVPTADRNTLKKFALQALLHDATEAYIPDMPSPIKQFLPDFKKMEKELQRHIFRYYEVPEEEHVIIKQVDRDIRIAEMWSMSDWDEVDNRGPLDITITPWDSRVAYLKFKRVYEDISSV